MIHKRKVRKILKYILVIWFLIPCICMLCYGIKIKFHYPLLKIRLAGNLIEQMPDGWTFDDSQNPGYILDENDTVIGYILINDDVSKNSASINWERYFENLSDSIRVDLMLYENGTKYSHIVSANDPVRLLGYKISYTAESVSDGYKSSVHLIFPVNEKIENFERYVMGVWWNYTYNIEYYKMRNLIGKK